MQCPQLAAHVPACAAGVAARGGAARAGGHTRHAAAAGPGRPPSGGLTLASVSREAATVLWATDHMIGHAAAAHALCPSSAGLSRLNCAPINDAVLCICQGRVHQPAAV